MRTMTSFYNKTLQLLKRLHKIRCPKEEEDLKKVLSICVTS